MAGRNSPEPFLVLTRDFDAPRELVYRAWTEAEHFVHWWGPREWTVPECAIDARPGGRMRFAMRGPDGFQLWLCGACREAVPPSRYMTTIHFADADCNVVPPTQLGMGPDVPEEMLMTVLFEDVDGKTRLTVTQTMPVSVANANQAQAGWGQSFDKLDDYLGRS